MDLCVRFGCVDHDLMIREYKHVVHNVRSAPVICPLNPMYSFPSEDVP